MNRCATPELPATVARKFATWGFATAMLLVAECAFGQTPT